METNEKFNFYVGIVGAPEVGVKLQVFEPKLSGVACESVPIVAAEDIVAFLPTNSLESLKAARLNGDRTTCKTPWVS